MEDTEGRGEKTGREKPGKQGKKGHKIFDGRGKNQNPGRIFTPVRM